jgi:N6-adenosine-specific RNA methylase IME4
MDVISKLQHLIGHWVEHNTEHARTYFDWSKKADALGKAELAAILRKIAEETEKLDGLFKKAEKLCSADIKPQ